MSSSAFGMSAAPLRLGLAARFSGPLLRFFMRRLNDRAQAEDLTQEVFLKIIRAADVEAIENADSYVFKAAANLLHDHRLIRHSDTHRRQSERP